MPQIKFYLWGVSGFQYYNDQGTETVYKMDHSYRRFACLWHSGVFLVEGFGYCEIKKISR